MNDPYSRESRASLAGSGGSGTDDDRAIAQLYITKEDIDASGDGLLSAKKSIHSALSSSPSLHNLFNELSCECIRLFISLTS